MKGRNLARLAHLSWDREYPFPLIKYPSSNTRRNEGGLSIVLPRGRRRVAGAGGRARDGEVGGWRVGADRAGADAEAAGLAEELPLPVGLEGGADVLDGGGAVPVGP